MAYEELTHRISETISDIHEKVVACLDPRPGQHWLDLACGIGAAAERAAARGAWVSGIDLAPALIQTARERAAERRLDIDYRVGDCERLDVPDERFDAVSSTCGVMFAPDHEATARELARITRPGGRIALANWTPTGGVGRMFKLIAPFQAATPPGNPFDWGCEDHVRDLLGDHFELDIEEHLSTLHVSSGEAYWDLLSLGERRDELRRAWVDFFETDYRHNGDIAHTREYLLVVGVRR